MRRFTLATIVGVSVALLATAPAVAATKGSQRAALTAAAKGVYTSALGTLEFHDDGTATFDLLACGYEEHGPGHTVTPVTSCDRAHTVASGPTTPQDHSFEIRDAAGTYGFDAYLDDEGALHVGTGDVGYLGRTRRGTAHLASEDIDLTVGNGTCREANPFDKQPVTGPCKFVQRDGREVLLYRGRDPFHRRRPRRRVSCTYRSADCSLASDSSPTCLLADQYARFRPSNGRIVLYVAEFTLHAKPGHYSDVAEIYSAFAADFLATHDALVSVMVVGEEPSAILRGIGVWEDRESADAVNSDPAFAVFNDAIGPLLASPAERAELSLLHLFARTES